MSYRYVYPNATPVVNAAPTSSGYGVDPGVMSAGYPNAMYDDRYGRRSYSPGSFSSDSGSDDYEYRGRLITRETRCPRDVVRAPTPPPIIKRVVERAPTPEAPVMERVIIRPQAQEIVERVIEQPRTPPPRIIQKEMHEEAPPPIVRTRVIKVDRPIQCGYSQPGSPAPYCAQSIAGSVIQPAVFQENNPGYSSVSNFEYLQQQQQPAPATAMMMPPQQTQMMYPSYVPQNYMYRPPMSFGAYHSPMMQQNRMISSGMPMPMMTPGQPMRPMFQNYNPMPQQLVY